MNSAEEWRITGQTKVAELLRIAEATLHQLSLANHPNHKAAFNTNVKSSIAAAQSLKVHFGSRIPQTIESIESVFSRWNPDEFHPDFSRLPALLDDLRRADLFNNQDENPPLYASFLEGIGENDQDLHAQVDSLINKIEAILERGKSDDLFSSKVEKQIERVLVGLRANRKSLINVNQWLDFAARLAATLFDQHNGTVIATLAGEALKLAGEGKVKIMTLVDTAEKSFSLKVSLPFLEDSQKKYPAIPWPENIQKRLAAPPKQLPEPGSL